MASEISSVRIAVIFVAYFVLMAAAFMGTAGTIFWPEAWLYLILQFAFSALLTAWLKRHDPALLKDRLIFLKPTARGWDKVFVWLSTVLLLPYLFLPGLDAVRHRWSQVTWEVEAVGFAGVVLSLMLIGWVTCANPYLSRVVEIQKERGHRVITTGPYRYVRHPMYLGAIVLFISIPLALGSLWTLLPAVLLCVLVVLRTYFEDRILHAELEGYAAYAEKVTSRLLPGIW